MNNETQNNINPLLIREIESISDPITKEVCSVALDAARDAFERGEKNVDEFISQQVGTQLTRIMREHTI